MKFYQESVKKVIDHFETNAEQGLSETEVDNRLKKYGPNKIEEKRGVNPFFIFLKQFKSPIVWILIVAMVIAFLVGEMTDMYVIGTIVILNAILGFIQEYRAEKAIEKLKEIVSLSAEVVRGGEKKEIKASRLVPGDIIKLKTGSRVPADARIIDQSNLQTQEAALTGESTSVNKTESSLEGGLEVADQENMLFSGTNVTKGHAKAVVVRTGMDTELGKIADMVQSNEDTTTPLQRKMKKIATKLGFIGVGVAFVVLAVGLIFHNQPISEMLLVAIALSVAVIPEGLPAVITLSLSMGVQRMIKKNALVRRLPSVETLGSASVICTDKTGTLTHNEMTVKKIFANQEMVKVSGSGYEPKGDFSKPTDNFKDLLRAGILNNNSEIKREEGKYNIYGDPTEGSLLVSAQKAGLDTDEIKNQYDKIDEIEFSSERKRMTTIHKDNDETLAYTKGALEEVLSRCDRIKINSEVRELTKEDKKKIKQANDDMAEDALRVLSFAYKPIQNYEGESDEEIEQNLIFLGLQGMIDPPRKEAKEAIEKCKTAGIEVKMITGDHLKTAQAIGEQIGFSGGSIEGSKLKELSESELKETVVATSVFARVNPEDKLKIIKGLKQNQEIVAMTGDGVNDAPALKQADLGIAMGITGTDVSKEASDMILADDNFATIEKAIEEGRRIFDNIKKFLAYLLSGNIVEVLIVVFSIMVGYPLPITAIQILWINLVTDGLPALALGTEKPEPGIMSRAPREQEESIFKNLGSYLLVYPIIITAIAAYTFSQYVTIDQVLAQSLIFTMLVFVELFESFACRSVRSSVLSLGLFTNKWLWLAVIGSALLQIAIINVPVLQGWFGVVALGLYEWLIVIAAAFVSLVVLEFSKYMERQQ
ncbi:MAG: calcium-translocating P-type ATPase, SERCA-type [Candidatus Magasanikbacteria bacterium]